jgi:hypothetical protein
MKLSVAKERSAQPAEKRGCRLVAGGTKDILADVHRSDFRNRLFSADVVGIGRNHSNRDSELVVGLSERVVLISR